MAEIITSRTNSIDRIAHIIYYLFGAINVMLLLRLIFKVFGANPVSPIVAFIYSLTNVFLLPFRGIFEVAQAGEAVVEPSVLVAIIIYSLLAKAIVDLLYIITKR